jgi:hypothetical protein
MQNPTIIYRLFQRRAFNMITLPSRMIVRGPHNKGDNP